MAAKPRRTLHEERQLRASIGLHLNGPMPSIRDLQKRFKLSHTAAQSWHAQLAAARREFGAPDAV